MTKADSFSRCVSIAAVSAVALGLLVGCDQPPPRVHVETGTEHRVPAAPPAPARQEAPAVEGIALAIVYDTSGSMRDQVPNASGAKEPKYKIAARALDTIVGRLDQYRSAPSPTPRRLDVGIWIFSNRSVKRLVPMAPFDAAAIRRDVGSLGVPDADTPLGEGLATAAAAVLASNLTHRHVLVVTDGLNKTGREPQVVLRGLLDEVKRRDTTLGVHFVAFDIEARVFAPLKELGATVLGAADERTLGTELGFIVEKKILLEDEEPAAGAK